jgi:hypothetical protein
MAERDPRARAAKPDQFIDGTLLREIEKSGFVAKPISEMIRFLCRFFVGWVSAA